MLHRAASHGNNALVNELLDAGANPQIIDGYQFSAYGLAMREEFYDTALIILKQVYQSEGAGTYGTCLHLAVAKLQVE